MTCKEVPKLTDAQIVALERLFNKLPWLLNHLLEPKIGHRDCPPAAEDHGIVGASAFTAFVEVADDGTYACRFERCRGVNGFKTPSLDLAVRHQRHHHFNHRPFPCAQCSKRYCAQADLITHQTRCP